MDSHICLGSIKAGGLLHQNYRNVTTPSTGRSTMQPRSVSLQFMTVRNRSPEFVQAVGRLLACVGLHSHIPGPLRFLWESVSYPSVLLLLSPPGDSVIHLSNSASGTGRLM